MKINSFAPINFNIIQKKRPSPNNLERIPNCDWVSFTGTQKQEAPSVVHATKFGVKFYQNLIKNTPEYVDDKMPETYSEKEILEAIKAYQSADKTDKMLLAMKSGFELTRLYQKSDSTHKEELTKLFNGDKSYENFIKDLSTPFFNTLENRYQTSIIEKTMNVLDRANYFKYGTTVPRALEVDEETIFKAIGVKDKKEFEDKINIEFLEKFKENCPAIDEYGIKIYKDLRKYCAIVARDKAEAYTTESKIAKEILGTDKTLNIDILPIYYTMVADTLDSFNTKRGK